ncbi:MAG: cell wall hydrolase [Sphingopyxis sp.]|nr:cell wall hydrolase [Sphingopyxis sp.]
MNYAMSRFRKSWGAVALLVACGMAMLAAVAAIYASTLPSATLWHQPSNSRELALRTPPEPEAFKFREGIAPLQAAEINAAVPESDEPILPAKPFAILAPATAGAAQLSAVDCMTAAIYYEAASESATGQRAVAQVILNRMRHPAYPNSVCGVVFQGSQRTTGCQFTFTCDGSLRRRPSASGWLRARSVATAALSGYVEPSVGYATHYHTTYVVPYWSSSLTKLRTVGSHIFYRWSGNNGTARAFINRYANAELIPAGAAANLSGYLLGSSAIPGVLDLASIPLAAEPLVSVAPPPSSGLKAPLRGELSSAPSGVIAESGSGIVLPSHKLKGDVAEPRLVDDRPRLID